MVKLAIITALALLLSGARESKPEFTEQDVHDLARICVNEAGFRMDVNDCKAIVYIIRKRANLAGTSIHDMARSYSTSVFDLNRKRRGWIPNLRMDLGVPERWPHSDQLWERRYKRLWKARLDEVRRALLRRNSPCEKSVFHWGTPNHPVDAARIERGIARGYWHPVNCGKTLNTFLARGPE